MQLLPEHLLSHARPSQCFLAWAAPMGIWQLVMCSHLDFCGTHQWSLRGGLVHSDPELNAAFFDCLRSFLALVDACNQGVQLRHE
jgi:hypothetical protein